MRTSATAWNGIWRVDTFSSFATAVAVKTGNAGVTIITPEVRASRIASYSCIVRQLVLQSHPRVGVGALSCDDHLSLGPSRWPVDQFTLFS